MYEWDEDKRRANLAKHGVDFAEIDSFDWETAVEALDSRHDEPRWVAIGYIGLRLHVVCFAVSESSIVRVISLRRATAQEQRCYAETQARDH